MPQNKQQVIYFQKKNSRWCVANQLSVDSENTNVVLFHAKIKPIPEHFDCIQTTFLLLIELNVSNI